MSTTTVDVVLFGDRRRADVKRCPRNWKVAWHGMTVDSLVPRTMATNAREAAIKAAAKMEDKEWGRFLAARISELRVADGALSTEMARWVAAKVDDEPFDRHSKEPAAKVHRRAAAALEAAYAPNIVCRPSEPDDCEECGGPHVGMIHGVVPADKGTLLPILLRDLSDRMNCVAEMMLEHGRDCWDGDCIDHAKELSGAAQIALGWSEVLGGRSGEAADALLAALEQQP